MKEIATDIVLGIVAFVLIAGLLSVLFVIIRYSIISTIRTRRETGRLRKPDVEGVEAVCGFTLSRDLERLFCDADFIELTEFTLVDVRATPPARWEISGFLPLTPVSVKEWRLITNVPGVPLALDFDNGAYYLAADMSVRLQSPNLRGGDVLVASSVNELLNFTVAPIREDDGD